MKHYINLFVVSALSVILISCATTQPHKISETVSAEVLFEKGTQQLEKKHYSSAVESFESLEAQYPFGPMAIKAQYGAIYAYFKNAEYEQAHFAAERFIRTNPLDSNVDYAYYMKALSHYMMAFPFPERYLPTPVAKKDVSLLKSSYDNFNDLITRYPNSKYTHDAKLRMHYLYNVLAKHEYHVAQFYCKREAYIACANRANKVKTDYPNAEIMPENLSLLAHAYRSLGTDDLATAINLQSKE